MENIIGRVSECFETGGRHFKHLTHNIMDKRGKLFFGLLGFCQGEGETERKLGMVCKFSKLTLQSSDPLRDTTFWGKDKHLFTLGF